MSLLLTNKLIHKEANPFLYNGHAFSFARVDYFATFIDRLGESRSFVKSVTIEKTGTQLTRKCYDALLCLGGLQKAVITLPSTRRGTMSEHMERHWEHMKLYVLGDGANEEESTGRLALIDFRIGPSQSNVLGPDGKVIRQLTDEMKEQCKVQLRGKLEKAFRSR